MTPEERTQLAELLEKFIETEAPIVEQLEKLGAFTAPKVAQEKQKLGAATLLLTYLRSGERQSL